MMLKCIICFKDADVMFEKNTYCKQHFDLLWKYVAAGGRLGGGGKSIFEMKKEFEQNTIKS